MGDGGLGGGEGEGGGGLGGAGQLGRVQLVQLLVHPGPVMEQLYTVLREALDTIAKKGGTAPHSPVLLAYSQRGLHCWHCAFAHAGSGPTRPGLSFSFNTKLFTRRLVSDAGSEPTS